MASTDDNQQSIQQLLEMLQGLGSGQGGQQGFPNFNPWEKEPTGPQLYDHFSDPSQAPGITQGLAEQGGWGDWTETVDNPAHTGGLNDPSDPTIEQGSWDNPWAPNELTGGADPFGLRKIEASGGTLGGWNLPEVATPNLNFSPVAYAGVMGAQGQVGSAYINALSRAYTDPLTAISRERAKSIGDLLNVVAGGKQERETLGLKSAEERKTLQDNIAGELAKIYAGASSGTAGKLAEIAEGGEQERKTLGDKSEDTLGEIAAQAGEERTSMGTKGYQERLTQEQQIAGAIDQIREKGLEERSGAETAGIQERKTQAEQLAGVLQQIGAKGGQERLTQKEQLEGVLGQIGQKGYQERETTRLQQTGDKALARVKGALDRRSQAQQIQGVLAQIGAKGGEERTTLAEQIAGELGKIGATGEQTRQTQSERAQQAQQNMASHAGLLQNQQLFGANLLQNMPMPDFTGTQAYHDLTGMAGQGMRQTNAMNMLGGPNPFAAPLQNIQGMVGGNNPLLAQQNMYNMQNQFNPAARAQHAQSAMAAGRNLSNQFNQQLANQTAAGRPFRSATGQVRGAVPQIFGQQIAGMSNIGIS